MFIQYRLEVFFSVYTIYIYIKQIISYATKVATIISKFFLTNIASIFQILIDFVNLKLTN